MEGSEPAVEHEASKHRFVLRFPEGEAELTYREHAPDRIVLVHTEVPKALGGRGIASRLAREALDYARAHQLKVVAVCPFVRTYLERHPEFKDIVASG